MRKFTFALLAVLLMFAVSSAGIIDGKQANPCNRGNNSPPLDEIVEFNPVWDKNIQHFFPDGGTAISIAYDGDYYYIVNGECDPEDGVLMIFDLDGNFIRTIETGLSARSIFYDSREYIDGEIYIKDNSRNLYAIDVETGNKWIHLADVFQENESKVAFSSSDEVVYEMCSGDVYGIRLYNGGISRTLHGLRHGSGNAEYAIACNREQLLTWDDSYVYAYSFSGTLVDSAALPESFYDYSLSYAGNRLWASEVGYNDVWTWHGASGFTPYNLGFVGWS
ncbi:MAG: hypothetical protein GF307_12610, partial [candidate division Zixibacteria bacterium]|nr:hypothetical protein [candidate division Zixibacteria bacterium]